MMKKINWFQLLVFVLITELAGVLSSSASGNAGQIYTTLTKPPLSPPGWLFGVIWPVLYLLMGIAAYIIYQSRQIPDREKAINLYWIQLFVNFLWPIVFFRFEWYWLSVFVILLLIVLVLITTIWFYRINKAAGLLMVPYLLWIIFAAYLNIGVAILN
ncbi:TspO/MBR family protein [Anaerocolumna sp. MB42-C2]|uniref:TspO/MBR family protein n=1 Tax=Anaerocolumna sp. MB42-C2 TaxID=3070997 RepID=UPI0027DF0D16|nr:TspO/MBR family protein [Anaerocolumna sp. MB42-C2]WMJ89163.1 TspO/MBR family protein [Anaerocolumna sp. MB42-C2]